MRENTLDEAHLDCKVLMDIARTPFLVTHEKLFILVVVAVRRWPIVDFQNLIER